MKVIWQFRVDSLSDMEFRLIDESDIPISIKGTATAADIYVYVYVYELVRNVEQSRDFALQKLTLLWFMEPKYDRREQLRLFSYQQWRESTNLLFLRTPTAPVSEMTQNDKCLYRDLKPYIFR